MRGRGNKIPIETKATIEQPTASQSINANDNRIALVLDFDLE